MNVTFLRSIQPFSAYQDTDLETKYHAKALEIARLADTTADPFTRADLLRLAAGYERLALRRCRAAPENS